MDEFDGLTDDRNAWKYPKLWKDAWEDAGPNDIIVKCIQSSRFFCMVKRVAGNLGKKLKEKVNSKALGAKQ